MKRIWAVPLCVGFYMLFLQACSTAKVRVLPGDDGVNHIISRDLGRDGAEAAAVKQAEKYCEKRDQSMFIVHENATRYEGKMDEETRNTIRKASTAAMIIGGPAGVLSRSAGVGGVLAGAGMVGHAMTNDRDYTADFTFRCR